MSKKVYRLSSLMRAVVRAYRGSERAYCAGLILERTPFQSFRSACSHFCYSMPVALGVPICEPGETDQMFLVRMETAALATAALLALEPEKEPVS